MFVCGVGSVDNERPTRFEIDEPCSAQYKLSSWYQVVSHANVDNKLRDSDSRQACLLLRSPRLDWSAPPAQILWICVPTPPRVVFVAADRFQGIKIRPRANFRHMSKSQGRYECTNVCGPIVAAPDFTTGLGLAIGSDRRNGHFEFLKSELSWDEIVIRTSFSLNDHTLDLHMCVKVDLLPNSALGLNWTPMFE